MPANLRPTILLVALVGCCLGGCGSNSGSPPARHVERTYTFAADAAGWTSVFADYPTDADTTADGMALTFDRRSLPDEVPSGHGLFLSGRNTSDDLFMGLRRHLTDLSPNTTYALTVEATIASEAPSNCFGVGGPPGEAVWVKAGGSATRPERAVDDNGWYRLSVDKGNQSNGGEQARVLGNIANGVEQCTGAPFRLITRTMDEPLPVTTDEGGTLWLLMGTDSGFEARTRLYYNTVRVTLDPLDE